MGLSPVVPALTLMALSSASLLSSTWDRLANAPTGTSLVCSFLEIGMSFSNPKLLRRVFPPLVTGTVILLIGTSLIGSSGILNWGGGSNNCASRPTSGFFMLCPDITAPRPLPLVFKLSR
jgi:xanthine/uracil permease